MKERKNMINEKIYQAIFDELSRYFTSDWNKLIVYLEYGNASYSFAFYIHKGDKYIKCYDIPNISEKELAKSFANIDKLISKERAKEKEKLWTNMTMTVTKAGQMHTDFDYTDLSGGTYQFKKNWRKKYLN